MKNTFKALSVALLLTSSLSMFGMARFNQFATAARARLTTSFARVRDQHINPFRQQLAQRLAKPFAFSTPKPNAQQGFWSKFKRPFGGTVAAGWFWNTPVNSEDTAKDAAYEALKDKRIKTALTADDAAWQRVLPLADIYVLKQCTTLGTAEGATDCGKLKQKTIVELEKQRKAALDEKEKAAQQMRAETAIKNEQDVNQVTQDLLTTLMKSSPTLVDQSGKFDTISTMSPEARSRWIDAITQEKCIKYRGNNWASTCNKAKEQFKTIVENFVNATKS